jgi:hypothetical protein
MKNQQQNNAVTTYIDGWESALRNYDVFETESIIQLVSSAKGQLSTELANIMQQNTSYLTINLAE